MTQLKELLWCHAIENEDFELADSIAKKVFHVANNGELAKPEDGVSTPQILPGSNSDIIETYVYWGLDLPSLPIQGTP